MGRRHDVTLLSNISSLRKLLLQLSAGGGRWRRRRRQLHRGGIGGQFRFRFASPLQDGRQRGDEPFPGRWMIAKVTEHTMEPVGVETALLNEQKKQKTGQRFVVQYLS